LSNLPNLHRDIKLLLSPYCQSDPLLQLSAKTLRRSS
jgi:hypothetical protein